ncbi:hypothetical protein BKK52_11240 [Rodentibacter trehalosifermentans]|uniref:Uncharacterized protein n=1 Tax=Rodentibacter trehalosifermentans TaxID=1908263 RepID=A0A1V3IX83_9PAST|nr:YecR family lipoprotein [Rodentibacter trehalosifermentans]OOF46580.1 hypothetical protein BKK52_11240 [Rodentibacter trehalosifermentans]
MKKLLLTGLACTLLVGCTVHKELVATGGSKSDGTIELSYTYSGFEVPKISEEQGLEVAKKRCSSWGYKNAEKFGGKRQVCTMPTGFGCNEFTVTMQYQCLDK